MLDYKYWRQKERIPVKYTKDYVLAQHIMKYFQWRLIEEDFRFQVIGNVKDPEKYTRIND